MFDVLSQLAAVHAENYVQRDRSGRVKKKHHTFEEKGKPKELLDLIKAHEAAPSRSSSGTAAASTH